jgi:hypothetical protein
MAQTGAITLGHALTALLAMTVFGTRTPKV